MYSQTLFYDSTEHQQHQLEQKWHKNVFKITLSRLEDKLLNLTKTSATQSRKNVTQLGLRGYLCNCLSVPDTHTHTWHTQTFQWQWRKSEGSLRSVCRLMSDSLQSRKLDYFVVTFISIHLGQEQLWMLLHHCQGKWFFPRNQRLSTYVAPTLN